MQYRTLGRTGIKVSPYGLGAMMFATRIGNPDPAESIRIIHKALDAGINLVDTADGYEDSEEIVGKRSPAVATTSFWRRSSVARWAMIRTSRVHHGGGSRPRSRARYAACRPTTSTCTKCTARTRRPTSRKHFRC